MFPPLTSIPSMESYISYGRRVHRERRKQSPELWLVHTAEPHATRFEQVECGLRHPLHVPELNHYGDVGQQLRQALDVVAVFTRPLEAPRELT